MTYRYRVVLEVESDHKLTNSDLHEAFTAGCWCFEETGDISVEATRVTAHSTNPKPNKKEA